MRVSAYLSGRRLSPRRMDDSKPIGRHVNNQQIHYRKSHYFSRAKEPSEKNVPCLQLRIL